LSVAASRLLVFACTVFLGLKPQAMNIPPLRGWFGSVACSHPETLLGTAGKESAWDYLKKILFP
jgi:hypothetical protein